MSESVAILDESNFDAMTSKGRWIIDFWAGWCGPCKIMEPHFVAAAKEAGDEVYFGKVNIEKNYGLVERYNIMSVPTTIFLSNGQVAHASVGALNKQQILQLIKDSLR